MVTDSLEPLAKYLIRRAQIKGTYELLGRMDVASAAWRENEDVRLKKLKQAAEDVKKGRLILRTDEDLTNGNKQIQLPRFFHLSPRPLKTKSTLVSFTRCKGILFCLKTLGRSLSTMIGTIAIKTSCWWSVADMALCLHRGNSNSSKPPRQTRLPLCKYLVEDGAMTVLSPTSSMHHRICNIPISDTTLW
jgi:hypothetical protein